MSDEHQQSKSGVPPLSNDVATQDHRGTPLSGVRRPRFPLRGLLLFVGGFSVLCALASATGMSLTEALIGLGVVSFVALATAAAISLGYPPDGTPPPNGD